MTNQAWHSTLRALRHFPWRETGQTLRERFREDHLALTASSLTFTTVISLVPLFTVLLAVFSAFPAFNKLQGVLQQWLSDSLFPDAIARQVLYGDDLATNVLEVGAAREDDVTRLAAESIGMFPLPPGKIVLLEATVLRLLAGPGHVMHDHTRRLLLRGADGIAFVADSQLPPEDNEQALIGVRTNLRDNGLAPDTLPMVIQLNKGERPTALTDAAAAKRLRARLTLSR